MNSEVLRKYKQAGKIAAQCLQYGKSLIKEGAVIREVLDAVEEKIEALGAKPAFPAQISLNSTAAHFCPGPKDDRKFANGDLVKLDVGVHVDGYVGDNAVTVDLGDHDKIVKASRAALEAGIKTVRAGVTLAELGQAIQEAMQEYDMAPVRNLTGHGLGKYVIHDKPSIPNYNNGDTTKLEAGTVIAIEPFATNGQGFVVEADQTELFALTQKKPIRSQFARQILRHVEKHYGPLPFTTRWLTQEFPFAKVQLGLRQLLQHDIIHAYPPLTEKSGGMVAQSEHTILVEEKNARILTKVE